MARKTSYINVLQFDERLISLLRVRRNPKGIEVVDHIIRRGHWSTASGALEQALEEFINVHNITQGYVCTVLPRHQMAARILTLPSQDPEEIAGMVRLNAEQYVPYPVEELVIDQCALEKTSDGYTRVLAVFAHRDVVETHLATARKAGLALDQVYMSSACLASAAMAALGNTEPRYALVNLGSTGLEILVLKGNRLEFSRAIATVQDWTALGEGSSGAIKELVTEVPASLSAHSRESEDGLGVDRIHLCSDWADVDVCCEPLAEKTSCECAPASFVHNLIVKGGHQLSGLPLVALGAALTAQGQAPAAIHLEPESMREARGRAALRRNVLTCAGLTAAVIAGVAALYFQAVWQRQVYIRQLEQRIAEVRPVAENIIEMDRQLQMLRRQVDRSETALELLAKVCDMAPSSGLNITGFSYNRGESRLTITGRAHSTYELNQFTDNLREAGRTDTPLLAHTPGGSWKMVQERGKDVIAFEVVIPFPKSATTGEEETSR